MFAIFFLFRLLHYLFDPYIGDNSKSVDLGYATYEGEYDSDANCTQFLGVRYAAAPIGSLRWRAPQSPPPVNGTQAATAFPPACMQGAMGASDHTPFLTGSTHQGTPVVEDTLETSEDCLFLSVYTPGKVSDASLPVVVWIHGGGYAFGGGDYSGKDLLQASGGQVVSVVIQYRLGLFGFLAGQAVKDDGDLNAGLLDQQLSLKWVQEHISKFGGDPSRVTIWGQSAGAGSVLQQVIGNDGHTSPPLFRNAMTSSTYLPPQYKYNDPIPEFWFRKVIERTGCATTFNALECLRQLDIATLQSANLALGSAALTGTLNFVPVVDDTFITQRPTEALMQGKVNGGLVLANTVTDEASMFVSRDAVKDVRSYLHNLFPHLKKQHIEKAANLYARFGDAYSQAVMIMEESIFVCTTYYLLDSFDNRSYKGEFAIPPARHGDDLSYLFPSSQGRGDYESIDFSKAFAESFMAFVVAEGPNETFEKTITPKWERYSSQRRSEMLFNRTEEGAPYIKSKFTDSCVHQRCEFWQSVGSETGQ